MSIGMTAAAASARAAGFFAACVRRAPRPPRSRSSSCLTALVLWLVLYPVAWLIWGAFHNGAPGAAQAGWTLENFSEVFLDANYWLARVAFARRRRRRDGACNVIGAPLAWLTVKTDMPGKRWVELSAIMPFFTSTFIGALAWILLANPTTGVFKLWLGIPIERLFGRRNHLGHGAVHGALHVSLYRRGAAQHGHDIRRSVIHVGRGTVADATRVTFPLILPALLSGMTLVFVISIGVFGVAAILGFPAKIYLLATEIYVRATLIPPSFGAATVSAITLMVITAALIVLQRWILRSGSYALVSGRGFRSSSTRWASGPGLRRRGALCTRCLR